MGSLRNIPSKCGISHDFITQVPSANSMPGEPQGIEEGCPRSSVLPKERGGGKRGWEVGKGPEGLIPEKNEVPGEPAVSPQFPDRTVEPGTGRDQIPGNKGRDERRSLRLCQGRSGWLPGGISSWKGLEGAVQGMVELSPLEVSKERLYVALGALGW